MTTRAQRVILRFAVGILAATSCRTLSYRRNPSDDRGSNRSTQYQCIWNVVASTSEGNSPIRFHFAAPEDSYAGEFPRLRGWLSMNPDAIAENTTGQFNVEIRDVTMGEPDLDSNVRSNVEFLQATAFPISSYVVQGATASDRRLDDGRPVSVTMHGIFKLKGVEIPLDVRATMIYDAKPELQRIRLAGSFEIEHLRERFRIAGPGVEGNPAGDQVRVEFNFELAR